MRSKLVIGGMWLLTATVVFTCARIECLNARYGNYLPRKDFASGNPKWRVASQYALRRSFDHSIAVNRATEYSKSHPGEAAPDYRKFLGSPYTPSQQQRLDAELAQNALCTELLGWVATMGLFQYVLAPAALIWSIRLLVGNRSSLTRLSAAICLVLTAASIGMMLYRGYFTSLGW